MKTLKHIGMLIGIVLIAMMWGLAAQSAYACAGFYTGSYVSGMNRICYYNHLGSQAAITVKSYSICPMQVTFDH